MSCHIIDSGWRNRRQRYVLKYAVKIESESDGRHSPITLFSWHMGWDRGNAARAQSAIIATVSTWKGFWNGREVEPVFCRWTAVLVSRGWGL